MFEIEFYEDKNGISEVYDYIKMLKSNNSKENRIKARKIDLYLSLLEERGLMIGEPYLKRIDKEIWEIRPLRDRILFASWYGNKFIILSVFMKQTNKTPRREIEKAKRYLKDYKQRSE